MNGGTALCQAKSMLRMKKDQTVSEFGHGPNLTVLRVRGAAGKNTQNKDQRQNKKRSFHVREDQRIVKGSLPTRSLSPMAVARIVDDKLGNRALPAATPCRMPQGSRSSLHLVVTCSASCPLIPPERAHIPKNSDSMQIGSEEVRFQNQTGRPDLESVLVKE